MKKRTLTISISLLMILSMLQIQILPHLVYANEGPDGDDAVEYIEQVEPSEDEAPLTEESEPDPTAEEPEPDPLAEEPEPDPTAEEPEPDPLAEEPESAPLAGAQDLQIERQTWECEVSAGEEAVFEVQAVGDNLTYQWQWSTEPWIEESWKDNTSPGFNQSRFSFIAKPVFNGRYYRCKVSDAAGNMRASTGAHLIVTNIRITQQPDPGILFIGSPITLHVEAKGQNLSYQWQWTASEEEPYKNNTSKGSNTDTFTFTAKEVFNYRSYRCQITDASGNVAYTEPVYLLIDTCPEPWIITQPEDQTEAEGDKVTYHVDADGIGLTYQWQWATSANGTYTNNTSGGCNTDTFTFTGKPVFNGRYYRCVITDQQGQKVTTRPVLTTIESANGPKITQEPEDQEINEGNPVSFHVQASGSGLSYQWQWATSEDGTYTNNTSKGYNTNTFTFTTKYAFDQRYYRCLITDSIGRLVYTRPAHLAILEAPKPEILTHPSDLAVAPGKQAVFSVKADGTKLTYQWQWANSENGPWTNNTGSGFDQPEFGFTARTVFDGRFYRCLVRNALGKESVSKPARISVTGLEPFAVKIQSEQMQQEGTVSVAPGEAIRLFAEVEGGPAKTYQWQWATSPDGPYTNNTGKGYNTDTFAFTAKDVFDGRYYRCIVKESTGRTRVSSPIALSVSNVKLEWLADCLEPRTYITDEPYTFCATYSEPNNLSFSVIDDEGNPISFSQLTWTLILIHFDTAGNYVITASEPGGGRSITLPVRVCDPADAPLEFANLDTVWDIDAEYNFSLRYAGEHPYVKVEPEGSITINDCGSGDYQAVTSETEGTFTITAGCDGKDEISQQVTVKSRPVIQPSVEACCLGDSFQVRIVRGKENTGTPTLILSDPLATAVPQVDQTDGTVSFTVTPATLGDLTMHLEWNEQKSAEVSVWVSRPPLTWNWLEDDSLSFTVGDEQDFVIRNVPDEAELTFTENAAYEITPVETDEQNARRYHFKALAAYTGMITATLDRGDSCFTNITIVMPALAFVDEVNSCKSGEAVTLSVENHLNRDIVFSVSGTKEDSVELVPLDKGKASIRFFNRGRYWITATDPVDGRSCQTVIEVASDSLLRTTILKGSRTMEVGEELVIQATIFRCKRSALTWTLDPADTDVVEFLTGEALTESSSDAESMALATDGTVVKLVAKKPGSVTLTLTDGINQSAPIYIEVCDTKTATFTILDGYFGEEADHITSLTVKEYVGQTLQAPDRSVWSTAEGKVFKGWRTEDGSDLGVGWAEVTEDIPDQVTLYACWEDGYIVTLDANGGHFPDGTTKKRVANSFQNVNMGYSEARDGIPAHDTQNDAIFAGWALDPEGERYLDRLNFASYYEGLEDYTIYARWLTPDQLRKAEPVTDIKTIDGQLSFDVSVYPLSCYLIRYENLETGDTYSQIIQRANVPGTRCTVNLATILGPGKPLPEGPVDICITSTPLYSIAMNPEAYPDLCSTAYVYFNETSERRLNTPYNLTWDGTAVAWKMDFEGAIYRAAYQLEIVNKARSSHLTVYAYTTHYDLTELIRTAFADGYDGEWSFRVRTLSKNMHYLDSEWSAYSQAQTFAENTLEQIPSAPTADGVYWEGDTLHWSMSRGNLEDYSYLVCLYEDYESPYYATVQETYQGGQADFSTYMSAGHKYFATIQTRGYNGIIKDSPLVYTLWNLDHYQGYITLSTPENLEWNGNVATWSSPEEELEHISSWQITLLKDGRYVTAAITKQQSYDFTDSITEDGAWTFHVCAYTNDSYNYNDSEYAKSYVKGTS